MSFTIADALAPFAVLRDLAQFVKRPRVLDPSCLASRAAWGRLGVMGALHVMGMLLLILPLIGWWQKQLALPLPDAFDKLPSGWLLPVTLVAAPVLEEVIFRGWQTGRPPALWLLVCTLAFAALAALASQMPAWTVAASLFAIVVAAFAGWVRLRRLKWPPAAYAAAYPAVFWLAAVAFAGMHLANYPVLSLATLPMVLPQLWAGVLLGFTRQDIGLPAAMLQHAGANAAVVLLTQLGG